MEEEKMPPWLPSPDCPAALARAFDERDAMLLEHELTQCPSLLTGEWFLCLGSQVHYPHASINTLFVGGDVARVAVSIRWWEGLEVIRRAGYPFVDATSVANIVWLAALDGDAPVLARILEGHDHASSPFPCLPLLALAGQPRDEYRRHAARALAQAFFAQVDPWACVPCIPQPSGQNGTTVCRVEKLDAKGIGFIVQADADLMGQLSCVHVLLSENLPEVATILAREHPMPASMDQALLLTHWFSGATRHVKADAKSSALALMVLVEQGLGVPSIQWMLAKSRTLESFGMENFDRLMLELVHAFAPSGRWDPWQALDLDDLVPATDRAAQWLEVLASMKSAAGLRAGTSCPDKLPEPPVHPRL